MDKTQTSVTYRWFVLSIIMSGAFMVILDMTIVNVALPHMMSALGVNRDKVEWVVTAFILTTAVTATLMGWLSSRFGYKLVYLVSLLIFTASSAACAFAWSFESLIAARVLQAIGGGAIQPVGLAIVADLFEPHERGRALGIWGVGIMVGPAVGPTLGGYLTEWFSWRAIFFVNVPVGILAMLFGLLLIKSKSFAEQKREPFDLPGFIFLAVALSAGLIALSNGQEKGWHSDYIHVCLAFTIVGLVFFISYELSARHPLLDLRLFCIRNYTLAILLGVFRATGLFGGLFLLPLFLENLVGYTTVQAGLWMVPSAVTVAVVMPIAGRLTDKYSYRWLVTMGTAMVGFSLFLYGNLDPLSGYVQIIGPQFIRGVGLAFMVAPLLTAALNAVPEKRMAMASSYLSVAQRVGASFGIALLNTYVTNSTHIHAVRIGELLPPQSDAFYRLSLKASSLVFHGEHGVLPSKALILSARTILHHALVLGFDNGFVLAGMFLIAAIPLALLLQPLKTRRTETPIIP